MINLTDMTFRKSTYNRLLSLGSESLPLLITYCFRLCATCTRSCARHCIPSDVNCVSLHDPMVDFSLINKNLFEQRTKLGKKKTHGSSEELTNACSVLGQLNVTILLQVCNSDTVTVNTLFTDCDHRCTIMHNDFGVKRDI